MTALVIIWGPLYIVSTIIVTLVAYWLARKFVGRAWPSWIVLGLAIAWPIGDVALTKQTLNAQCGDRSGAHIYRTVENVAGFFITGTGCDGSCQESLIDSNYAFYRFIEARVGELEPRRNALSGYRFETSAERYKSAMVPGPGLYRFTREEPGHPNCKNYDEWLANKKGLQGDDDYINNCIATWKIDEISSQYGKERFEYVAETVVGDVRKGGYLFRDLRTDEILAESTSFVLSSNLFWSFFMNPHVCRAGENNLVVYDVLKPARD